MSRSGSYLPKNKLLAIFVTVIVMGLGLCSISYAQDSNAQIATLNASGVKDWVEINRNILNHPRVDAKSKETSLSELQALRDRIGVLKRHLGTSETDRVTLRILDGNLNDIDRMLEQHAPPKSGDEISREHKALTPPKTRSEQLAQIERLNAMIDACSKAIRDLYKQRRSGAITQEQLHNLLHGDNGYDRLSLTLIHRKNKIRSTVLQADTKRRREYDRARGSIMDEFERPENSGVGMSPDDHRRAAAAALEEDQ